MPLSRNMRVVADFPNPLNAGDRVSFVANPIINLSALSGVKSDGIISAVAMDVILSHSGERTMCPYAGPCSPTGPPTRITLILSENRATCSTDRSSGSPLPLHIRPVLLDRAGSIKFDFRIFFGSISSIWSYPPSHPPSGKISFLWDIALSFARPGGHPMRCRSAEPTPTTSPPFFAPKPDKALVGIRMADSRPASFPKCARRKHIPGGRITQRPCSCPLGNSKAAPPIQLLCLGVAFGNPPALGRGSPPALMIEMSIAPSARLSMN